MSLTSTMTRAQALAHIRDHLTQANIEEAYYEARLLVQFYTGVSAAELITQDHLPIGSSYHIMQSALERRLGREPLSRIIGQTSFWTFDLCVAPHVLDPRSDSETLITASLHFLHDRHADHLSIADLGTGSGALLCALLSSLPHARGIGLDISPHACALAQHNLKRLELDNRASILHADWSMLEGQYDLIISNPPYIETKIIAELDPDVRDFDPHLALDGGPDGLAAYRSLMPILKHCIKPQGCIVLEIGAGQSQPISNILKNNGFSSITEHRDLSGHIRALCATPDRA
jgi:release factor glutamine methyltransferase